MEAVARLSHLGSIPELGTWFTALLREMSGGNPPLHRLAASEPVLRIGEPADDFLVVLDGTAAVLGASDDERPLSVGPGALLGELGILFSGGRGDTVCLVGLRGAGKTTLGRRLAQHEGVPFVELDREVERELGATIGEILALHGQPAYRRTEAERLAAVLARHALAVIETGGGFAIEPSSLELLLEQTRMVWVRASPEGHMQRVVDQGDLRPMVKNRAAMTDLRRILRAREPGAPTPIRATRSCRTPMQPCSAVSTSRRPPR